MSEEWNIEVSQRIRRLPPYLFGRINAMRDQKRRQGVDIIVACPGRLLDHMQNAYAQLDGLEVLVLD